MLVEALFCGLGEKDCDSETPLRPCIGYFLKAQTSLADALLWTCPCSSAQYMRLLPAPLQICICWDTSQPQRHLVLMVILLWK